MLAKAGPNGVPKATLSVCLFIVKHKKQFFAEANFKNYL